MSARFGSFLSGLPLVGAVWGQDLVPGNVEQSYRGQLGQGTGLRLLETWCALHRRTAGLGSRQPAVERVDRGGHAGEREARSRLPAGLQAVRQPWRRRGGGLPAADPRRDRAAQRAGGEDRPVQSDHGHLVRQGRGFAARRRDLVPEVKAADADGDGTVTMDEMRIDYPRATLVSRDMTFSISHSVRPASQACRCHDCHGRRGWVLDRQTLGYAGDARRM